MDHWDRSHDVFHENKLPYICSMYDAGFNVLSMKINYFAPFKHKHKHQKRSLFSWKTSWLLSHGMKECQVANFHGQASDTYAYVWMVQGSLFSSLTLWSLCQTLNRCKVAYFHGKRHGSYLMQISSRSVNKHGRHRQLLFLIGRFLKIFSFETEKP
jgi:hypothetical protein